MDRVVLFLLFSNCFLSSDCKSMRTLEINIPADCKMFGICENVPDFPTEIISSKIKELKQKNTIFTQDRKQPLFNFRSGSEDEYVELCQSKSDTMRPRLGKNVDNQWRYVLNTDEENVQEFKIEKCSYSNETPVISKSCSAIVHFNKNMYGTCVQKYVERKMYALDQDTKEVVYEFFPIPIFCSCVARNFN